MITFPESQAGGEPVTTVIDARPAALVDGAVVTWGQLRPILNELAGGEALEEIILDRKITQALAEAGVSISPSDVAAERKTLLESLHEDPNTALQLLEEVRERQGLGPYRFEALMERNTALRALVRDRAAITPEAVNTMYDIVHGPKRQARIAVLPDLALARTARERIERGEHFADVAVEMSTDSSAARGGLLEPISRSDPAYPAALRQTLWAMQSQEISDPVLLTDRFALLKLEREIPGDGVPLEEVRPQLERMVKLNQERILMDQLARRLMHEAAVTIFDDHLNDSWSRRKKLEEQ